MVQMPLFPGNDEAEVDRGSLGEDGAYFSAGRSGRIQEIAEGERRRRRHGPRAGRGRGGWVIRERRVDECEDTLLQ